MRVVIPFAVDQPKSRLEPVLTPQERDQFARAMLRDVLRAVEHTGHTPEILANAPFRCAVPVTVDDQPLTPAVNHLLRDTPETVAVVMADLALATPHAIARLFNTPGDVVLQPGRGGGTNAFVARHPGFRVDYHGTSYLDHLRIARDIGASVAELDSARLATDIDEPDDLTEVLLLGDGTARTWLKSHGFRIDTGTGRPSLTRAPVEPDPGGQGA